MGSNNDCVSKVPLETRFNSLDEDYETLRTTVFENLMITKSPSKLRVISTFPFQPDQKTSPSLKD